MTKYLPGYNRRAGTVFLAGTRGSFRASICQNCPIFLKLGSIYSTKRPKTKMLLDGPSVVPLHFGSSEVNDQGQFQGRENAEIVFTRNSAADGPI